MGNNTFHQGATIITLPDGSGTILRLPNALGDDKPLDVAAVAQRIDSIRSEMCPEPMLQVKIAGGAFQFMLSNRDTGAHKILSGRIGHLGAIDREGNWPDSLEEWRHDDERWPIIHPERATGWGSDTD